MEHMWRLGSAWIPTMEQWCYQHFARVKTSRSWHAWKRNVHVSMISPAKTNQFSFTTISQTLPMNLKHQGWNLSAPFVFRLGWIWRRSMLCYLWRGNLPHLKEVSRTCEWYGRSKTNWSWKRLQKGLPWQAIMSRFVMQHLARFCKALRVVGVDMECINN